MILVFFILGLIVGSFLNALIYRLHSGDSIVLDRSVCPVCRHKLAAVDLVPLASFALLGGRCRYCQAKISWQYPAIEALTGVVFVLFGLQNQFHVSELLVFELISACLLIVIAVFDLKYYLILDKVLAPAVVLGLIHVAYTSFRHGSLDLHSSVVQGLIGIAIVSGFFGFQYLVSGGRWIGFGDVKFGIFLGLIFGLGQSLALLSVAYCTGAVVGLALIAFGYKKSSGRLPFGTFLGFSAIIIMLAGEKLVTWYLRLIGL